MFVQNHKPVVSVCQKASGSLPKDLSKTNLDPHCSKRGATDRLLLYVTTLSKAALADNKNLGLVDLSQWTKASRLFPVPRQLDKYHVFFLNHPNHVLIVWKVADCLTVTGQGLTSCFTSTKMARERSDLQAVHYISSKWIKRASSWEETAELITFCFLTFTWN